MELGQMIWLKQHCVKKWPHELYYMGGKCNGKKNVIIVTGLNKTQEIRIFFLGHLVQWLKAKMHMKM